jgi:hypothetical protein
MKIGFTGTQEGMTKSQRQRMVRFLELTLIDHTIEFGLHGDCEGADFQFDRDCFRQSIPVTVYPPENPNKRAFCENYHSIKEPKPYLDRNHDIVNDSNIMIACPKEFDEQLRSGTWATIRYARKQNKPLIIFYPDGSVSKENWNEI